MTHPAQSLPDAGQPDPELDQEGSGSPFALIAVVGVSALVIILCVLGATLSGLFTFGGDTEPTAGTPAVPEISAAAGPVARFDDGQYLIQRDVLPGTYATTVPDESSGCGWERRSSTDGTASSVLESGQGESGEKIVVNIKETDKIFQTQGCGTWERTAEN